MTPNKFSREIQVVASATYAIASLLEQGDIDAKISTSEMRCLVVVVAEKLDTLAERALSVG